MVHRPYGRRPIGRDQAHGFAIGVIIAAIAIIGVVATASYTIFGNQLVSMNRVSREDLNLNLVRTAARVIASLAEDVDGDAVIELPAWLTGAGPSGGGVLPADFPGNRADAWGSLLGYCTWDNGATNASVNRLTGAATDPDVAMIMAIISSGPNKTFETTCADAAANVTNGDDFLMRATTIEAATGLSGGESVWTKHSETMISYGETQPGIVRVGVGTATPSQAFVVHSQTTGDGIRLENATQPVAEIHGAGAGNDAGQMTLYNGGTARARIDANGTSYLLGGSLGIGIDNPTNLLEINRNQSSPTGSLFSNTDAAAGARSYMSLTSNAGTTTLDTRSTAGGATSNFLTTAPTLNLGSSHTNGALTFSTGSGNVNRMTIDNAGRFGIGVAPSPTSAVHIAYELPGQTTLVAHNSSGSASGNAIYAITNTQSGFGLYGDAPNTPFGSFTGGGVLGMSNGGHGVMGRSTSHIAVGGQSENSWGGHFVSINGPALYAQTNNAGAPSMQGWNPACGYSQINVGAYGFHTQCNMYATGSYQGSDERLKENIAPILNATDRLMKLRPVQFDWRENSDQRRAGHRHDMGLIAQEVQKVLPDIVREVPSPMPPKPPAITTTPGSQLQIAQPKPSLNQEMGSFYAVEYTRLIPYLIKALQEQTTRNDQLEARLVAIEKAIAAKQ